METYASISIPSRIGRLTGKFSDAYPIYRVYIPSAMIDQYLPDKLHAFSTNTTKGLSKRFFFYSKPAVKAIRSQMNNHMEDTMPVSMSMESFFQDLLGENDSTIRYNFVILDDCLILIRVPRCRHLSYYALSKHIALSNRAKHVRFAGEMWCEDANRIGLNNSSGTYRPPDALIEQVLKLFHHLTPPKTIEGMSFEISAQPSMKRQVKTKIKQKLTIDHNHHHLI